MFEFKSYTYTALAIYYTSECLGFQSLSLYNGVLHEPQITPRHRIFTLVQFIHLKTVQRPLVFQANNISLSHSREIVHVHLLRHSVRFSTYCFISTFSIFLCNRDNYKIYYLELLLSLHKIGYSNIQLGYVYISHDYQHTYYNLFINKCAS